MILNKTGKLGGATCTGKPGKSVKRKKNCRPVSLLDIEEKILG